jgi:molecular chaperone HtpG
LLPRYLRFVRGIVDTSDLPLNISREMIQDSPLLAAVRKGVTNRVVSAIEKLVETDAEKFLKIWEMFGSVIKEGLYDDFERRTQLLALARFRTTASGDGFRSLADYVKDMKEGQTSIFYSSGSSLDQLQASPQLEGFRARGIEVLLLTDPIDSFWTQNAPDFEGKSFKSITQGLADLDQVAKVEGDTSEKAAASDEVNAFIGFAKEKLSAEISDVRVSDRLTESAACLVASEHGYDRQLEKLLQGAGRLQTAAKPVLELNPQHALVKAVASVEDQAFREDAAWLLLDEARILDGDKPANPRDFAQRLSRLFERALIK